MRKAPKRMHLNRETLRMLENPGLKHVAGGFTPTCGGSVCIDQSGCITCTAGRCCPP
jgi:hypothetical protein